MAESLSEVILSISADTSALEAGLAEAKKLAQQAGSDIARRLNSRQVALGALQAQLKAIEQQRNANPWNAAEYDRLIAALKTEISLRKQSLQLLEKKLAADKKRADIQVPERVVGVYGKIGTALAGLGAGFALQQFFSESITAAIQLETTTKKLSNTLGEQGAGKALSFTKGLADQLGLSFTTLSSTFSGFTAAASAASVPLETQRNLFAAVAKAAQQLGLSNEEISGSLLALQQVASKGTVQMEELRGQLGERLPIAFGATAKGLGITQQELIKLVETGRLTADVFFPALTKGLNELTSSSEGAPTAAQNLQILQNRWKELQTEFGTNLLPTVTDSVKALTAALEGIGRKQVADRLGFSTGAIGALGFLSDEAITAAESYKRVQSQLNLTNKEADRLFSNAAKNVGIKNLGLADEQQVERVVAEYERLADLYRQANPDQQDLLSQANAESERLRQLTIARIDAEKKLVEPAKERLRDAQAIAGLEGLALREAQAALQVDKARVVEKKAIEAFNKAAASAPAGRETPAMVEAAEKVRAAGLDLQVAIIGASESLRGAAKEGADRFITVISQLTNARLQLAELQGKPDGLNRFLTGQEQFDRTRQAIISLGPELRSALDGAGTLLRSQGVGIGRELFTDIRAVFDNAVTGRAANAQGLQAVTQFIRDFRAEQGAVAGVFDAEQELANVNKELANVSASLRDQIVELVGKKWNVAVNLSGASGAQIIGDVVGATS